MSEIQPTVPVKQPRPAASPRASRDEVNENTDEHHPDTTTRRLDFGDCYGDYDSPRESHEDHQSGDQGTPGDDTVDGGLALSTDNTNTRTNA